jgi:hypothetical protein
MNFGKIFFLVATFSVMSFGVNSTSIGFNSASAEEEVGGWANPGQSKLQKCMKRKKTPEGRAKCRRKALKKR